MTFCLCRPRDLAPLPASTVAPSTAFSSPPTLLTSSSGYCSLECAEVKKRRLVGETAGVMGVQRCYEGVSRDATFNLIIFTPIPTILTNIFSRRYFNSIILLPVYWTWVEGFFSPGSPEVLQLPKRFPPPVSSHLLSPPLVKPALTHSRNVLGPPFRSGKDLPTEGAPC